MASGKHEDIPRLLGQLPKVEAPSGLEQRLRERIAAHEGSNLSPIGMRGKPVPIVPYSIAATILLGLLATYISTRTQLFDHARPMPQVSDSIAFRQAPAGSGSVAGNSSLAEQSTGAAMATRRKASGAGTDQPANPSRVSPGQGGAPAATRAIPPGGNFDSDEQPDVQDATGRIRSGTLTSQSNLRFFGPPIPGRFYNRTRTLQGQPPSEGMERIQARRAQMLADSLARTDSVSKADSLNR